MSEKTNVTLGIQNSNRVENYQRPAGWDNVIAAGQTGYQPGEVCVPACGVHPNGGAGGEQLMSSFAIKHPFFILIALSHG